MDFAFQSANCTDPCVHQESLTKRQKTKDALSAQMAYRLNERLIRGIKFHQSITLHNIHYAVTGLVTTIVKSKPFCHANPPFTVLRSIRVDVSSDKSMRKPVRQVPAHAW